MSNPKSVIETAREQGAKMVDVKFVDTFGTWQHFRVPMSESTEDVFTADFLETWSGPSARKPMPCACAPIPTNFTCIMMSNFADRQISGFHREKTSWKA